MYRVQRHFDILHSDVTKDLRLWWDFEWYDTIRYSFIKPLSECRAHF